MAVETLDSRSFSKLQRDREANEAVSAGLENMQRLIKLLSQQLQKEQIRRGQGSLQQPKQREDCSHMADATISEFKKVVSLLSRCGHARFRRAPGGSPPASVARVVDALLEAPENCSSSSGVNPDGHGELYDKGMSSTSPDNQSPGAPAPPQVTHITMAKAHVSHINSASSTCKIEHESAPGDTTVCGGSANAHTMPQLDNIYSPSIPHVYVHLYASDSTVLAFPTQQCFHQTPTILNPPPPQAQQCISQKQPQPQPQASEVFARSYSQLHNSISLTPPPSTTNSSFASSVRMDGSSVTNDKQSIFRHTFGGSGSGSGSGGVGGSGSGSGLPPLSATKRKCSGKPEEHDAKCNSSGRCHCAKRRKVKDKRTVRVPAISVADTPVDLFSWRKYGQKPVKGSPYPRGYFKCSTVRACPARKHVEQALDDPNILVVTYKGEHNHS